MVEAKQEDCSGEVPKPHSVGAVRDQDLGVLTITEIAPKFTNAVPPTHFLSWAPKTACVDLCRRCSSRAPLTWLARFARRQSLSTGHLVPGTLQSRNEWEVTHMPT